MEKTREKFKFRFLTWAAALILSVSGTAYSNVSIVQAEQTVYVKPTGSKYHAYKCGNGTYTPTTLSNALARGLTPCSKCFGSNYTPSSGNLHQRQTRLLHRNLHQRPSL